MRKFAEYLETDVLIIGGGISGCTAALVLAEKGLAVTMLVKGKDFSCTNTYYAQGGIASLNGKNDNNSFVNDILAAGDHVNDPQAVRQVVRLSDDLVYRVLIDKLQVPFAQKDGQYALAQEGGHHKRRVLHVKDMTGRSIQESFEKYLKKLKKLKILFEHTAIDLLTYPHHSTNPQRIYREPKTIGAYVLDQGNKKVCRIFAQKVILASGGLCSIYLNSTNPKDTIGDGIAMAYRAGARLANLEYIQFHPTALYLKEPERFLISETVRGEGAKLMNRKGELFMKKYSAQGELAPRDEVSRAIYAEMIKNQDDYVLLDLASYAKINIRERFPTIYAHCVQHGIDIEKQPIPVVPAAHYSCGGVIADLSGRTSLKNLYAIGEVSATGVHGANRLASVSLLEGVVWGVKSAESIIETIGEEKEPYVMAEVPEWRYPLAQDEFDPALVYQDFVSIKHTMWNYCGIIRTQRRMERARSDLDYLRHRVIRFYEKTEINNSIISLRNAVQTAQLVVTGAQRNRVSKGAHFVRES